MTCCFCDGPVDTRTGAREVTGWERLRPEGGLHGLTDRHETGRWACQTCWRKLRDGVPLGQQALL